MRTISRMLLKNALSIFLIAIVFFVIIIQVIDLFANLTRYINQEVPFIQVLMMQSYFIPKSISFALPMALLFSIAFTMGTLYSNNELVAILGAGIPLFRLVLPLLFLGIMLSVFSFYFEDNVVIQSSRIKNQRSRELLGVTQSFSNADVTLIGSQGQVVYFADYYNDATQTITNVLLVIRSDNGMFHSRVEGRSARWNGRTWEIPDADIFLLNQDTGELEKTHDTLFSDPVLDTPPSSFRRQTQDLGDLTLNEASQQIQSLQTAGLPFRTALTEYYERFAFSLTPFIVTLLSCAIGSRLKKNIVLLSLLLSLTVSVGYYVIQMVLSILAGVGGIPPVIGAFSGATLFFIIGSVMLLRAKT